MKLLRAVAAVVVFAGACLTGRAVYLHGKAELAGILIRKAWDESVRTGEPYAPWPWADTQTVARLQIPRLHYDEIVLEGATPRTLAFGPARLLNSAHLGEPGNLVLAGHRTSWFLPLKSIAQGDVIRVQWLDRRQHRLRQRSYTVSEVRIIDPHDTALLEPTFEDVLTLVTCYPFGSNPTSPQRFVVRAMPSAPARVAH